MNDSFVHLLSTKFSANKEALHLLTLKISPILLSFCWIRMRLYLFELWKLGSVVVLLYSSEASMTTL